MNETEIDDYLKELDRIAEDIGPIVAESFRERADEFNLDPIGAVYILSRIFIQIASYCDYLLARAEIVDRKSREDLITKTTSGIADEWRKRLDHTDKFIESER